MKKKLVSAIFLIFPFWAYFLITSECETYFIELLNKNFKYVELLDFNLDKAIQIIKLLWFVVFSIVILYTFIFKKKKNSKYNIILSSIITLFILIGNSYIVYGTFLELFNYRNLLKIIIKILGIFYSCTLIINYLEKIFSYPKKEHTKNKIINIFNKHPFIISLIVLICAWSVYYIAFYPIILSPDPSNQIKQFMGVKTEYSTYNVMLDENVTITNHHPVLHTILLGSCAKAGKIIGNDNFGLFIYSFIQGMILAITLAYTIKLLKDKKLQNKYVIPILLIYAFVPHFPLYALNGNKDVFYSIFFMWILIILYSIANNPDKKLTIKQNLFFFISLLLLGLFRNNGLYLIILLFPFTYLTSIKNRVNTSIIFGSVVSIIILFTFVLLPALKITGTSKREALSVFFQSTARYVQKYGNELSNKDKKIISNIIDYKAIKKYNPELADPVKNTYNKYATNKDLNAYFKVWIKCFFKHPTVYIDSIINNTYGYFDIEKTNWNLYFKYDTRITENGLFDYHYNSHQELRNFLAIFGYIYTYIPIIGMISNIAFNTILSLAFGLYLIFKKQYKYLLILMPTYITILTCIVGPANTYFRYAMPYIFSMPFIIGIWIITKNQKKII